MKLFEYLNIVTLASLIFNHFKTIDNYVVKSDEENIDLLLKNDRDKNEFEKTIDEMLREGKRSKDITLNNKNITISI